MSNEIENVAATVLRELPKPEIVCVQPAGPNDLSFISVPLNHRLEKVDFDALLPNPRRIKSHATLTDAEAFLTYVARYKSSGSTVVWVEFNPKNSALQFSAVFDDHAAAFMSPQALQPGWRGHRAVFKPELSIEWQQWTAKNAQQLGQLEFAQFIEDHIDDVRSDDADGMPTNQQILQMATQFEYRSEMRFKSSNKNSSGATILEYTNGEDSATAERMELFKQFRLGIPVFWGGPAYSLDAKLRYRVLSGKVVFFYDLQRYDKVHEHASRELIEKVRDGIGSIPLLMGSST